MKILTFDIEEWFIEQQFHGGRVNKYQQFDGYLKSILDLLDETETTATFFCLGKIAKEFPYIVRDISERGHEIGCHSNEHIWLTKMTPDHLRKDTREALDCIQDVLGQKVLSYRAPAFSIGAGNKWAFEVLANEGIEYDASVFPAARDFGGFASFPADSPSIIKVNGSTIKEFPICLTKMFGKAVAFSGGGYFRFYPYQFIKNRIDKSQYTMSYFHIGDLLHDKGGVMSQQEYEEYFKESGSLKNRLLRYIKSNLGTKGAYLKMEKLIRAEQFMSLEKASESLNWGEIRTIEL